MTAQLLRFLRWSLRRLSEPSSYAGIAAIVASINSITNGADLATGLAGVGAGIVAILKSDPRSNTNEITAVR